MTFFTFETEEKKYLYNLFGLIDQGRASGMDWTLNLIFGKSETSRDIKK